MVKFTTRSSFRGTTEIELQSSLQYLNFQQQASELSITEEEAVMIEDGDYVVGVPTTTAATIPTPNENLTQHETVKEPIEQLNHAIHENQLADESSVTNPNSEDQTKTVEEECPLCCDPMSIADIRYPLHCPTGSCKFNYCSNCIKRFLLAASDGYEIASDGSRQLRVTVKCPYCRARYIAPTEQLQQQQQLQNMLLLHNNNYENSSPTNNRLNPNQNKMNTNHTTDTILVQSVLTLRNAVCVEQLLTTQTNNDSHLSSTDLRIRQQFIDEVSVEELEDAYTCVQQYQNCLQKLLSPSSLDNNDTPPTKKQTTDTYSNALRLVPLNWEVFRKYLSRSRKNNNNNGTTPTTTSSASNGTEGDHVPQQRTIVWKDPTLFLGLEELMTSAEHEFLTSMMTSGESELIAQAATILSGVMDMSLARRNTSSTAVSNHTATTTNQASRPVRLSSKCVDQIYRARKRYPLPIHMPRCVTIPAYDPLHDTKDNTLQFEKDTNHNNHPKGFTLVLNRVSGIAGRIGLRKGDIVTHVDGNEIHTYEEFVVQMQQVLSTTTTSTTGTSSTKDVQIIVNATNDNAIALQKRAHEMQKDGVTFSY